MSNFQEVQNTIANLYNSKVQSKFYKADTKFLEYMATVINFIAKEREKELNNLVVQFSFINNYTKLKQDVNDKIKFIKNLDNVSLKNYNNQKSYFEQDLRNIDKLNTNFYKQSAEIQSHKLMQDFLADTKKNFTTNNYNNYKKQFDELVIDIKSQLDFYSMIKKYPSIENFSALKREIQNYKNNNRNYLGLIQILIPVLEEIKKVNNQFYQQSQKIQNHSIMKKFFDNYLNNLNTTYYFYESEFQDALRKCIADIDYHEGIDCGDFRYFGDGVVLDKDIGLYWVQYKGGYTRASSYNIYDLNRYKFHNFDDWRLPTLEEAEKIIYSISNSNYSDFFKTRTIYSSLLADLSKEYYYVPTSTMKQKKFDYWNPLEEGSEYLLIFILSLLLFIPVNALIFLLNIYISFFEIRMKYISVNRHGAYRYSDSCEYRGGNICYIAVRG